MASRSWQIASRARSICWHLLAQSGLAKLREVANPQPRCSVDSPSACNPKQGREITSSPLNSLPCNERKMLPPLLCKQCIRPGCRCPAQSFKKVDFPPPSRCEGLTSDWQDMRCLCSMSRQCTPEHQFPQPPPFWPRSTALLQPLRRRDSTKSPVPSPG